MMDDAAPPSVPHSRVSLSSRKEKYRVRLKQRFGKAKHLTSFEWNSVASTDAADASSSFADLNETEQQLESEVDVDVSTEPASAETSFQEFEFNTAGAPEAAVEELDADEESTVTRIRSMMEQELESVDFYIAQGYSDIAADTLELLERQFGSNPEIDSRREELLAERQGGGVVVAPDIEMGSETGLCHGTRVGAAGHNC